MFIPGARGRRIALGAALLLGCTRAEAGRATEERAWADAVRADSAALSDSAFAALVAELSEPGAYFDTDNLISNERSYLHVMGELRAIPVTGGAYIGVGPDQNFSYIAQIRPRIAYIIDIRRDNLLQHLLYKALFELSRDRAEFLALLLGRPVPEERGSLERAGAAGVVAWIDGVAPRPALLAAARARVDSILPTFGVPLSPEDLATIARIHERFAADGLDLRFSSHGRAPRPYYPTFRDLILETDRDGRLAGYLASEEAFRAVQALQRRNLVVPVVGDLAGPHALAAIGRDVADRGERVSAFYTSNVEFYLMRGSTFDRYAENVRALPYDHHSVIIRSYFAGGFGQPHPRSVPGYFSTQLLQPIAAFVAEEYGSYSELVRDEP